MTRGFITGTAPEPQQQKRYFETAPASFKSCVEYCVHLAGSRPRVARRGPVTIADLAPIPTIIEAENEFKLNYIVGIARTLSPPLNQSIN